jgi:spermidine synthase
VRYLHFGTQWVQGAMCIARPNRLELEYQQQMMAPALFVPEPQVVVQLGLGAAALAKFCHRHLPASRIVAVELSERVIAVARQWFALPPDDARLRVVQADARRYLEALALSQARGIGPAVDWLQVDLYDAQARGPVYDDADFYGRCRRVMGPGGVAAFNLFGSSLRASLEQIRCAFGDCWLSLPRSAAGNTVVLGFAAATWERNAALLRARAQAMQRRWGLPAPQWLAGMRAPSARPPRGAARGHGVRVPA